MLVCAALSGGAGASDAGALLEAARRGDTAQVASLLERKVEFDAPSADGSTRLLLATAHAHLAVARQWIEAGADVNRQNSRLGSPYLLAGPEGRQEFLRLTLLHAPGRQSTNRYGVTPLI
ncbi:ankyrin repeat domain-containing protein, partial [Pseudomonas aeruginosa]